MLKSNSKLPIPNLKLPKAIMLIGPTASGKTDLAIAVAKKFHGEVISLDSRQMYRGLDIGAAIPVGVWRRVGRRRAYFVDGVPHHLMRFRSPARPLTAAEVKELALRVAAEVVRRGRLPIFCGGTGLYADMIAKNFVSPRVPPNAALRRRLEKLSTAKLFAKLRRLDPVYASRIAAGNRRHAIRALEVITATGQPFSTQQQVGEPLYKFLWLGVKCERSELYGRINRRFDAMMAAGLLREVRLLGRRYGWKNPVLSSLGHRQLGEYLRGERSGLAEATEACKSQTRAYARRQLTWFRRNSEIRWVRTVGEAALVVKAWNDKCRM